jgi:serine/threonine protein kinase
MLRFLFALNPYHTFRANILISDAGSAVLADFGLSRISHEETTTLLHGAGSPRWMAPELIMAGDEETGPLKSPKTDVYAFGHIMLEVCCTRYAVRASD